MSSWRSYPSIFSLGHKAISDLLKGEVLVEEKCDGCLVPQARVLTADLTYCHAEDLKLGDELVGFDDRTNDPRLCVSIVTSTKPIQKETVRLCFDDGREVTASTDHPWLVRGKANNLKKWLTSEELSCGDELVGFPVWQEEKSYLSGYLAAAFDGEGSLVKHGNGRILSFYQAQGPFLEMVKQFLTERGFQYSEDVRQREEHWKKVSSIVIRGRWPEIVRFLGTFQPKRLCANSRKIWEGAPTNGLLAPRLVYKEKMGKRTVIGLSTSTHTYTGEGLLCHNSQFSFGVFDDVIEEGQINSQVGLRVRSKGAVMHPDAPEKMFTKGVEHVKSIQHLLHPGWTYRGEYLAKPRHNALAYDRVPKGHIIIFDINTGEESYLPYPEKRAEAERLGLECVPLLFQGKLNDIQEFRGFLDTTSVLGGQKIEGVVVKPVLYDLFGRDKKVLMGKFVSEAYKEVHSSTWRADNPTNQDILALIGAKYSTAARWQKAQMHLEERGLLAGDVTDIGLLIREVPEDIKKECEDEIKEKLFEWAWPSIRRQVVKGLPEFYKEYLLKCQFEVGESF